MDRLARVEEFARDWQCKTWCLRWLGSELDVEIEERLFGRGILGVAIVHPIHSMISVNSRYMHGESGQAIMAHEAAHVLLREQRVSTCHQRGNQFSEEQLAWAGAARLAVSDEYVEAFEAGEHSLYEIAERCHIPLSLARLGVKLPRGKRARSRSLPDGSLSIFFQELQWELREADAEPRIIRLDSGIAS